MSAQLLTTMAVPSTCPRCAAPVLSGLAEGLPVRVDIQPVNRAGEIEAIRAGHTTYLLRAGRLEYREAESILAERNCAPLLISHICDRPASPAHWEWAPGQPVQITAPTEGIPF